VTSPVDQLAALLADATEVVALTGAGISTESGIPDFRGPDGVWTRDPTAERLTHWPSYRDDPQVRRRSWQWRVHNPALDAEPNDGHRALARLATDGSLTALVTQNTDGLHVAAGTPRELVHELHGSMREVECPSCGWTAPMRWAMDAIEAGDDDPRCPDCSGITKAATAMFGQSLPEATLAAAVDATTRCDLFLAIGTSLSVHPAAGLPRLATEHGATLAICNAESTPLDALADLVVRDPLGDVLPAAVDRALGG
jgi:NAD-dependent deacetylase